ncbi:hypothetical protein [Tautonia rosea]|uniref:hypothetical protein n=1 Tax=Tautonia rosea TaxID=2728037 RepID=UPI0014755DF3|nr:hypothetical protein [Tautonia rosea]
MTRNRLRGVILGIGVTGLLTLGASGTRAQGPFTTPAQMAAFNVPRFQPGGGEWARVVTATPKWIVLENAAGQQFPVSFGAIEVFVIRWPADPRMAGPGTLAEVTGVDLMNGSVVAGHVDLFEGSSRALVTPTSLVMVGYNRVVNPNNPFQMNVFGRYSMIPGEEWMPQRRHLVGALIAGNPIVIAPPRGPSAMVVPGSGGMSVTQVTIGSPSFVRPGDLVWYLPVNATPQTLAVGRLVIHKTIPLAQFVP